MKAFRRAGYSASSALPERSEPGDSGVSGAAPGVAPGPPVQYHISRPALTDQLNFVGRSTLAGSSLNNKADRRMAMKLRKGSSRKSIALCGAPR